MNAIELKQFVGNLCCECYADPAKHLAELEKLERDYPTYSERTECSSKDKPQWGDIRLGRLPAFLYDDATIHTSQVAPSSHLAPPAVSAVMTARTAPPISRGSTQHSSTPKSLSAPYSQVLQRQASCSRRMSIQVQADRVQARGSMDK